MSMVRLAELIDVKVLQKIQDGFSAYTGMAALTTDETGAAITTGSGFSYFCQNLIRRTGVGGKRCEECAVQGAKRTMENEETIVYSCHTGLVDFSAPIVIEGRIIGSFTGGQVRVEDISEDDMRKNAAELGIDPETYIAELKKLPVFPIEKVKSAAKFLQSIAETLSGMAYQSYLAVQESHRTEERARFQSEYFSSVNVFMQAQLGELISYADASREKGEASELQASLKEIYEKGTGILSSVDSMTSYLNLVGGNAHLLEEIYTMDQLAKQLENETAMYRDEETSFTMRIAENVPQYLYGDPSRIFHLISVFLRAAFERAQMGEVVMEVTGEPFSYATYVSFRIADNGIPLTDAEVEDIRRCLSNNDIFRLEGSDMEREFALDGLLLHQLSGTATVEHENDENVICIRIPQLAWKKKA